MMNLKMKLKIKKNNNFMETKKNIIITGGCGFIGSHIVENLAKKGNNVCVVTFGVDRN